MPLPFALHQALDLSSSVHYTCGKSQRTRVCNRCCLPAAWARWAARPKPHTHQTLKTRSTQPTSATCPPAPTATQDRTQGHTGLRTQSDTGQAEAHGLHPNPGPALHNNTLRPCSMLPSSPLPFTQQHLAKCKRFLSWQDCTRPVNQGSYAMPCRQVVP